MIIKHKKLKKLIKTRFLAVSVLMVAVAFWSCDPTISAYEFDLPEAGSIADATPPNALFSYSQGQGPGDEWKTYTFGNQSTSATTYAWDFGDGNTSTDLDAQNTYPGEGTWTVTLTASDALGVTSTHSEEITVVEPEAPAAIIPVINEAGFEDGSTACGTAADGRDCWRNSDLGGVIQITSSPVQEGSQASKYPSAGDRIAYQELTLSPNTDYVLKYYYTLKTNNPGSVTVSVLAGGGITDASTATVLGSFEGTDQTSSSTYVQASVLFNSGANDIVAIYVSNQGEEARVDNFTIELGN